MRVVVFLIVKSTHFLWLIRTILNQLKDKIWSTLSCYIIVKGNVGIVDKELEFNQVDREREWDEQIGYGNFVSCKNNGVLYYWLDIQLIIKISQHNSSNIVTEPISLVHVYVSCCFTGSECNNFLG